MILSNFKTMPLAYHRHQGQGRHKITRFYNSLLEIPTYYQMAPTTIKITPPNALTFII